MLLDLDLPRHLPPLEVAADTFLLRASVSLVGAPVEVPVNSLVILGAEPMVIDTGLRSDRDAWLADLEALVPMRDVRWVLLSNDAEWRRGNLDILMDRCPHATLLLSWAGAQRGRRLAALPARRLRWLEVPGSHPLGDRRLRLLRPPVYDSPTSRALFDPATGLLWAADTFATPTPPGSVDRIADLPPRMWAEGMAMLHHHALAPWLRIVDRSAYAAHVEVFRQLRPSVVVSAHAPLIDGRSVDLAFAHLAALPDIEAPPHPAGSRAGPRPADRTAIPPAVASTTSATTSATTSTTTSTTTIEMEGTS